MVLDKKTLRNVFIGVGGCILLYWILHETDRVTAIWNVVMGMASPFILGAALAFILNVPMRAFESLLSDITNPGLRRAVALILTFIAFILVLSLVFWLLIPQIGATIESLIPKLLEFVAQVQVWVVNFLNEHPELMKYVTENTDLQSLDWASLIQRAISMVGDSVSTVLGSAFSAIGSITGAIVDLVVGLVFALYCLSRKEILSRQGRRLLYAFLPEKAGDEIVRILRLTNSTFSNFLSGQCVEVCILGCLFAVTMAVFRMPYIPLVSVLVAVTAFIPLVGAFVGCFLGAFFILVDDPILAVGFVVMFLILQQIENNMIYPRVVGTSIGLPGMWVLVAVTVGGEIMGVAGMFLMIPLASVLYTLLREYTTKRLEKRGIAAEKLVDQPPEIKSHFKARQRQKKENRLKKHAQKTQQKKDNVKK